MVSPTETRATAMFIDHRQKAWRTPLKRGEQQLQQLLPRNSSDTTLHLLLCI